MCYQPYWSCPTPHQFHLPQKHFLLPTPALPRRISPDSLAILKAQEVIAVNQDPLGVAGDLIWQIGQSRVSSQALAFVTSCFAL